MVLRDSSEIDRTSPGVHSSLDSSVGRPARSSPASSQFRIWLAVHAWYHPASDNDSYRRSVAESLKCVGVQYSILRGRGIPSGRLSQAVLPLVLRNFMRYGNGDGLIHDLYGDSVFRNVSVSTIQDLYWNSSHLTLAGKSVRLAMNAYQDYRRTLRRSKLVITTTPFIRAELLASYGSRFKDKIRVIPIACQPELSAGAHSTYDVVWIGSSLKRKAPVDFVRSIAKLPKNFRIAIRLRIVSKRISDNMEEASELLNRYRMEGRTIDLLSQELPWPAIETLYQTSRCLVSTSRYEGFHMPVAEAYLRGVNVVLPDADFYRVIYGDSPGVHWYKSMEELPEAIARGVQNGPFNISRPLADRLSFKSVGNCLKAAYEEVSTR